MSPVALLVSAFICSLSPSMVDSRILRPSAGFVAAQRALSVMSPTSGTEYSNHAVFLVFFSLALLRTPVNTVPMADGSGGVPT